MIRDLRIIDLKDDSITIGWNPNQEADYYRIYWSNKDSPTMKYRLIKETKDCQVYISKSTHIPHYFKVTAVIKGIEESPPSTLKTPVKRVFHEQLEDLNRGLVAIKTEQGIFLCWRFFLQEVHGYSDTGMTGVDFYIYKNEKKITKVTNSTNYLDTHGTINDSYSVSAVYEEKEEEPCVPVKAWCSNDNYMDIPLRIPDGGVTPAGEEYTYQANDMSVGDVDGDGEYEYLVKWDPTNSHDVSIKGYTGNCYIDCYKLDGTLLWRLDMGVNIRAGAHYTQFMVYDFNQDGKAEMAVKTAPGTNLTTYHKDGSIKDKRYITMPESDIEAGFSHQDNYVCSTLDYRNHLAKVFLNWHLHPEVKSGGWPSSLEECFGIKPLYQYPLSTKDAEKLVEYFIYTYAPSRDSKNKLDLFEGFIMKGPEYLTMFGGDGMELQTIPFPMGRVDDGLMWGDYAMPRIEPCNRVDRFLSGVAYLDGERPYLVVCRGYYTRAAIVAYDFFENKFQEYFHIDSGFVPMDNPFCDNPHMNTGTDPIYGILAGQGNHSLSTSDVDGDGYQEIIYGATVIDHDGRILYSSYGKLPDKSEAKLGHGDALHVGVIDPDRPGLQIFSVFEGGRSAPYGYALRDADNGEVIFGKYATEDLGRCMIGDISPNTRGLQVWVKETYSCKGEIMDIPLLGTNQSIRWAADLSTQIIDGVDYLEDKHIGVINDITHGIMLYPKDTVCNNGTKGNPCLVADLFGDFREEILLRREDNKAIRIYMNTEITGHKLFTLMHDIQYRTSIAWQNNCYNQPGYTKFYYGSDMNWEHVLLQLS